MRLTCLFLGHKLRYVILWWYGGHSHLEFDEANNALGDVRNRLWGQECIRPGCGKVIR